MTQGTHKFNVGDQVVFTNCFGVCWGVKKITSLEWRPTTRDDEGPQKPCYHYEDTDTPWYPVDEDHLTLATEEDLVMDKKDYLERNSYFQRRYGFTPTDYFGCW